MASTHEKRPSASGSLQERPVARLLQQLFRKQVTGSLSISDATGDESDIYLRTGMPVHVHRPVDIDRLDRVLVEYGLVPEEAVARADAMVTGGMRLGEALERTGALSRESLSAVLKDQMRRKLTRLFCVAEGSFAIYLDAHSFGEGDDLAIMRVDPRTLFYPAMRSAYDLPRVTRELSRLWGQEFRLAAVSPSFISAMGIPADDPMVAALRARWMSLEAIDSLTERPLELRTVLLSLYYADLLERQNIGDAPVQGAPAPAIKLRYTASDSFPSAASSPAQAEMPLAAPSPRPSGIIPVAAAPAPAEAAPVPAASPVRPPSAPDAAAPSQASAAPRRSSPTPESSPRVVGARAVASAIQTVAAPDVALRTAILELTEKLDTLSHFELLGVSESATAGEVSSAFIRAARRYHPDRLAGSGLSELVPEAERILARMSEAAMILGDPTRRAEYLDGRSGSKLAGSTIPTVLDAETSFLKGEVLLRRGDHAKAIEWFAAASKANPGEPQYRAYWAWARFDNPRGRKESVVREVQRIIADVVAAQPRFARGHYWLGQIWKFLNEPDRAERAFREAVNQDKEFIEATREMRLLQMRRTRKSATRKDPDPPRGGLMSRLFKK
jgi:curved DNA-binding protein CbpA